MQVREQQRVRYRVLHRETSGPVTLESKLSTKEYHPSSVQASLDCALADSGLQTSLFNNTPWSCESVFVRKREERGRGAAGAGGGGGAGEGEAGLDEYGLYAKEHRDQRWTWI